MNRKELRPGNLVHCVFNTTEGPLKTEFIIDCLHRNTAANSKDETCGYSQLEPIPITEECLVRMGAKWFGDYLEIRHNNIELRSNLPNMEGAAYHFYFNGHHMKEVFFVHDVQNTWHAITGTELEILTPRPNNIR